MLHSILAHLKMILGRFIKDEKGAETLEYIAIAAIVIVLGAAAYATTGSISGLINAGLTAISGAISNPAG